MTRAQTVARLLGTGLDGGEPDSTSPIDGGNPATVSSNIIQTFDGGTP
jgi:hypothetical protein